MLLDHTQLANSQSPQFPLYEVVLQPHVPCLCTDPGLPSAESSAQVQNSALALVDFHMIVDCPAPWVKAAKIIYWKRTFENSNNTFFVILHKSMLVEVKAKTHIFGVVNHMCSSFLNSTSIQNLCNSSESHWHLKGVLALFLCSCGRQDVLSTFYH